ncbi:protein NYNRIN-like [Eupeodes corollae]|uniref:protein NYNRIN-like n=1 Tax=Eupeodes corollae TaxID=290404 RepID=UPI002493BB5F|nr:protein NYNRIN-like [Eupeodes corollae]
MVEFREVAEKRYLCCHQSRSTLRRIAVYVAGPFPETNNRNRYILVVMDYFSQCPEAYAIPNQEAKTVVDQIVFNWVSRFGVPSELHSDQGRNFESNIFQEVCGLLDIIKNTRITALHPQSEGIVERFNRTLKEHLCKVVDDNQRDWDRHIILFLMAYRSAKHSSTDHNPSDILIGRNTRLPSEIKFGCPTSEPQAEDDYIGDLRERLLQ